MTRRRRLVFVVILVLQALLVVGMSARREIALQQGHRTTLQTAPVDPRDLFRGDHVVLRYEISRIDYRGVEVRDVWDLPRGTDIWVGLQEDDVGIARPVVVSTNRPLDFDLVIRGQVEQIVHGASIVLEARFGIEQYFVPAGRGFEIETAASVLVVVSIGSDGVAQIDHLLVDGSRWEP